MENRSLGDRIAAAKRELRGKSHDGIERRTVRTRVELRAGVDGVSEYRGHAYVFNDLSEDLGFYDSWFERIAPGAGSTALRRSPDIRALFNHDPNLPLARTTIAPPAAGWLTAEEDDIGLDTRFVPTPTTYANDLRVNVDAGLVTQMSFAFRVARKGDSWEEDEEGRLVRTIHQFSELYDVSPVTYPAYPTTDVGLASNEPTSDEPEADDDEPENTTPPVERTDDEPAEAARPDGDEEDQQVGTSARDERAERLRLRIGEPPL